jgi:transglutaminase-like putative cysteine protease
MDEHLANRQYPDPNLASTQYLDADHPSIVKKAQEFTTHAVGMEAQASALFVYVRDSFPYRIIYEIPGRDYFKASVTLARGEGFCMPKSVLLAALARAVGIPSRLHFADIRNRILPPTTTERLRTDVMAYHTYVEMHIGGGWVKATPSFDLKFCERFGLLPVDFDGAHDAMLNHLDKKGRVHIEYIADYGVRADFPLEEVVAAFRRTYPHLEKLTARLS